ncbi:hypothetical protein EYF80_047336 [Liparis tanakae]|uniref:Uncharacterized protein n=1 Tax=Liparis tanakae TaxID=230148 RepID=A0A4Z2FN79_9TELE|nr:hypothetical protein EYF80_047336 [Liparis tanakae]
MNTARPRIPSPLETAGMLVLSRWWAACSSACLLRGVTLFRSSLRRLVRRCVRQGAPRCDGDRNRLRPRCVHLPRPKEGRAPHMWLQITCYYSQQTCTSDALVKRAPEGQIQL